MAESKTSTLKGDIIGSLINTGLNLVTNFIGGLFGKSKTKKVLNALQSQADMLMVQEQKQKSTIKWLLIGLGVLVLIVVFFFFLRRRK